MCVQCLKSCHFWFAAWKKTVAGFCRLMPWPLQEPALRILANRLNRRIFCICSEAAAWPHWPLTISIGILPGLIRPFFLFWSRPQVVHQCLHLVTWPKFIRWMRSCCMPTTWIPISPMVTPSTPTCTRWLTRCPCPIGPSLRSQNTCWNKAATLSCWWTWKCHEISRYYSFWMLLAWDFNSYWPTCSQVGTHWQHVWCWHSPAMEVARAPETCADHQSKLHFQDGVHQLDLFSEMFWSQFFCTNIKSSDVSVVTCCNMYSNTKGVRTIQFLGHRHPVSVSFGMVQELHGDVHAWGLSRLKPSIFEAGEIWWHRAIMGYHWCDMIWYKCAELRWKGSMLRYEKYTEFWAIPRSPRFNWNVPPGSRTCAVQESFGDLICFEVVRPQSQIKISKIHSCLNVFNVLHVLLECFFPLFFICVHVFPMTHTHIIEKRWQQKS